MCGRQSWPALWSTFGRTIKYYLIDWLQRTGSTNRLWLIRQTDPMSSGVTRNSRPLQIMYPSLAKGSWSPPLFHALLQHMIWQPTWPADQRTDSASARLPGGPVRSCKCPSKKCGSTFVVCTVYIAKALVTDCNIIACRWFCLSVCFFSKKNCSEI